MRGHERAAACMRHKSTNKTRCPASAIALQHLALDICWILTFVGVCIRASLRACRQLRALVCNTTQDGVRSCPYALLRAKNVRACLYTDVPTPMYSRASCSSLDAVLCAFAWGRLKTKAVLYVHIYFPCPLFNLPVVCYMQVLCYRHRDRPASLQLSDVPALSDSMLAWFRVEAYPEWREQPVEPAEVLQVCGCV